MEQDDKFKFAELTIYQDVYKRQAADQKRKIYLPL